MNSRASRGAGRMMLVCDPWAWSLASARALRVGVLASPRFGLAGSGGPRMIVGPARPVLRLTALGTAAWPGLRVACPTLMPRARLRRTVAPRTPG